MVLLDMSDATRSDLIILGIFLLFALVSFYVAVYWLAGVAAQLAEKWSKQYEHA